MAKREVYERADGKWGWRVKADNGQVVANDGNQGYESLASCEKMRTRLSAAPMPTLKSSSFGSSRVAAHKNTAPLSEKNAGVGAVCEMGQIIRRVLSRRPFGQC